MIVPVRRCLQDFGGALSLLSTLPVPRAFQPDANWQPGRALVWFPAVGWIMGGIVGGVFWIGQDRLPPLVVAVVTLGVWLALSGFLHFDGLIDSCDALFATVSAERRLEIMKDPRAGSFGVAGAGLVLLTKFAALSSLHDPLAVVVIPPMARALLLLPMLRYPSARKSAPSMAGLYRVGAHNVWRAALWLIPVGLIAPRAVIGLTAGGAFTLAFGEWAARRLDGGLTGDVYGATCEFVETLCLIVATL